MTASSITSALSQPPPFLQEPGEPAILWKQWFSCFENYILAIGGHEFMAERKKAILLHCIGVEAQRVYSTLPHSGESPTEGSNSYEHTVKVLKGHFQPSVNVVAERYAFRQRAQRPGEGMNNFISALRELVKTSDFGEMTDEMIRDQVVEKTNSAITRETPNGERTDSPKDSRKSNTRS